MPEQSTFNEKKAAHMKTLVQFVPIVDKVHGEHHPEFHEVRSVFDQLNKKINEAGTEKPDLAQEFAQLRGITQNYTVPGDVCESYEAVYKMLRDLDEAYER